MNFPSKPITILLLLLLTFCRSSPSPQFNDVFCPENLGLQVLPPTFPATSLWVGFTQQATQIKFIEELVQFIDQHKLPLTLKVLIPRLETEVAYIHLKKYFERFPFVSFLTMPSDETLWVQDYLELAFSLETGEHLIIDLPYKEREGEYIPSALGLLQQWKVIPQAEFSPHDNQPGNGDYGGNIEGYPGNLLVIGNTLSAKTRDILAQNLNQEIITLPVEWLENGHVDEIVNVVPLPGTKTPCNFALLQASPQLGLDLIQNYNFQQDAGELFPPIPDGEEPYMEREDFSLCHSRNLWTNKTCAFLLKANQAYEALIEKSLTPLKLKLKEKTGCQEILTLKLPQLYVPEKKKKRYGQDDDLANPLNPNLINGVSLYDHYLLPQQALRPFQEYTEREIPLKTKLKLKFFDGKYINFLAGGLHCATQVVRSCTPKKKP